MKTLLLQTAQAGQGVVVIAPSFAGAMQLKKQWAEEEFSFGLTIATLSSWVQDRWELYGDGRVIVSSNERNLLVDKALRQAREREIIHELAHTPGTIKLLASMAKENLVELISNECSEKAKEPLTVAELEVLEVLKVYAGLLSEHNLCEYVQALVAYTKSDAQNPVIIVEDRGEFIPAETAFLTQIAERSDVFVIRDEMSLPVKVPGRAQELIDLQLCIYDPDPESPLTPSGAVRFLLPAGNYAAPLLIAQKIVEASKAGDANIAVSAKDPETLFHRIAEYVTAHGMQASLSATKHFKDSDFGAMFINLLQFMFDQRSAKFQLSDVVLGAFSDISQKKANALDLVWRADRSLGKEDYLRDVQSASPLFNRAITLLQKQAWVEALEVFEAYALEQTKWARSYRAEQLKSISNARDYFEKVTEIQGDAIESLPLLMEQNLSVSAYLEGGSPTASRVDVMSFEALADLEACSYDTVIVCDLDTSSYPIREAQDAKTHLFDKLGIASAREVLIESRNRFFRVLSVPKRQLICERTLNTVEASKSYPAIMLEELFDCYRHDLLALDELDRASSMPKVLLPYTERAGEDKLYRDVALVDEEQASAQSVSVNARGLIREEARNKILLPYGSELESTSDAPMLSPSAIESYLECPYKWFALRRLKLEGIDASFGPLEMGLFSHSLLKDFYQQFLQLGHTRVLPENLDEAKDLLATLFDQYLRNQADKKYTSHPLIPLTKLESAEAETLKKKILAFIERDSVFLPGFTPRYFEQDFGNKETLEFAGCRLHGTVDRIDVNEKGQAVVIDYKGSVGPDYALASQSELPWAPECADEEVLSMPHKVQALLYAQAIRKELDLDVVGSLYVSYGKASVAGAYNPKVLGPAEIPGVKPDKSAATLEEGSDFSSLLDEFEASLVPVLDCLKSGYIRPYPRGSNPCGFCPVTACEMRR
ncbi:MAG: PD-(D/E)XK nuclease family protein [Raoultibacter sp.]